MVQFDSLHPVSIPEADEAFREDVRAFVRQRVTQMPATKRARSWMGCDSAFSRELGGLGWLGLTFPKEFGGGGRSPFARYVLVEELLRAGAPVGAHWIADRQSGPLLLKYGSEEQKKQLLPGICRGELFFCIGMSEPGAGSDLASVTSSAVESANGWTLSGQKTWTTNAGNCQYMIALVRTSGSSQDRQKGLSQILVDLKLPGVTVRPILDLAGDSHFCEVFFDKVELGRDALIGREGEGWQQVNAELAYERSGPERLLSSMVLFDEWLRFIAQSNPSPMARRLAGRTLCRLAPLRAMSLSVTSKVANGESPAVEAALVKDLGTLVEQEIPEFIADDLATRDPEDVPPELLRVLAYTQLMAPSYSLRGGTREILRGMIARSLGLR